MDYHTNLGMKRPDTADRARPLCYGDFVMLSCAVPNQGSAYLCEEGCIMKDPDVEMRVSSRELTFQICTAHDARTLQDINNLRQKYGIQATDIPKEKISFHMSPSDAACYERLLKSRITEEHANDAYSKQMKGRPVTYGDILQLRHIKRQSYLGVDISQAPRIESCTKRIFLTSDPAGMVRFKILPRFHYLMEGNTVCFGDNISLCSADLSAQYLHTSPGFRSEDIGIVYEVNLSADRSTIWGLECFFSYDSLSETHVKTGDVVRLHHPSSGGLLAAAPGGAAHSVVLAPCDARASMSSTMWVVEDEAVVAGGLLRTMRSFALMHLVSKRYLVATRVAVDPAAHRATPASHSAHAREDRFAAVGLEHASTPAAGLLLQSLEGVSANACVAWGGRFHVLSAETGRYLHAADATRLAHPPHTHPHPGDRVIVASPAMFREDSFEIQRVPDEQVRAVEALSRMLPAVRGYCEALQGAVRRECTADFPSDRAVEVMDRLDAMRAFVYTGAVGTAVSEALGEDSALSPRPECQNFMRDLGVDDLLADLLRHSCALLRKQWHLADPHRRARLLAAEEQALHGRSEKVRLRGEEELAALLSQTPLVVVAQGEGEHGEGDGSLLQAPVNRPGRLVCELAYEVLLHMVRRNRTNAVRLAKHLEELQQQLALRVGSEQLMREILDGNDELLAPGARRGPRVLHKRHLRFHIDALVREGGRDPRHLSFLAMMVAIGNRGVEEHQDLVLPELLRYRADIFLDVQVDNQTLQIRDRRSPAAELRKWVDLSLIVTGAARSGEDGAAMRLLLVYWRESLLLLSSLCRPDRRGRRDFVVRRVQSLVTFETCLHCLDDDNLPTALRWAASELVRVAFVERDDFAAAARRGSVVVWADLDRSAQDDWPPRRPPPAPAADGSDEEARDARTTTGAEPITQEQADALKRVLREYFEQNPVQYYPARVEYANRLRASMLRLGRQLVRFGHYRASELADVLHAAVVVVDVSNLRIEDEDQRVLAAASQLKPIPPQGPATVGGTPGGPSPAIAMEEAGVPAVPIGSEMVTGLTEATISCALRRLRRAAQGLSPLEVARLRCVFEVRNFAAGQPVAQQGALQEGMYFIQSGTAFCVKAAAGDLEAEAGQRDGHGSGLGAKGGAGRAETVVMTLAPGQVFGLEALTGEGRARWPWHVRCAAPVVALFVPAGTFERMVRQLILRGPSPLTDGLVTVLEMMREACLILGEVYDIRLQLRNRRLLQEYHFDVQVSGRRYRAAPRAAEAEAETEELRLFPPASLRRGPVEVKTRFRVRGVQVHPARTTFNPYPQFATASPQLRPSIVESMLNPANYKIASDLHF